jgi:hypothetical protein
MTDPVGRFMIRQGQRGLMMVWDREKKGPATIEGRLAIGMTEAQAVEIKAQLTKLYAPRDSEDR